MTFPNLSAFAVREQAITLFLIIAIAVAGTFAFTRPGPGRGSELHRQGDDDRGRLARRNGGGNGNAGRRPDGKAAAGASLLRQGRDALAPGLVFLTLQLRDDIPPAQVQEQFYQARKKVSDEAAFLPQGVLGPLFNDEYSDVYFALYALQAPGMPHRELVREAESLRQRMLGVPGVKKVNILGEQAQKIFVEFSISGSPPWA
jgi:multidrug efflux pump subunit AcrB